MALSTMSTPFHRRFAFIASVLICMLVLASCASDDQDTDAASVASDVEPTAEPTATEEPEPSPTPVPETASDDEQAAEPEPTATPEPADEANDDEGAETEPTPDIDYAPELAGLSDWRNGEPVTLEELRGEPVILVFWNSI